MSRSGRRFWKAVTWQFMGVTTMSGIGYLYTGSFSAAGSVALTSAVAGFLGYMLHEWLWERLGGE